MERLQQFHRSDWFQVSLAMALGFCLSAESYAQSTVPKTVPTRSDPAQAVPVPDVNAKYLFDKDRRYLQNVKDLTPIRGQADDHDEFDAYNELVLHASKFSTAELNSAARLDIGYGDLFSKGRESYRFDLIQFAGRLKRLKKIEPNEYLKDNGVKDYYEAWIVPTSDTNPLCILLTEKPEGIEPNLEYNPSYPVIASGYFFKLFEYQSKEPSEKNKGTFLTRRAPLLMGKSLTVRPQNEGDGGEVWREYFLPALLTFVGLMTAFILGTTWYFRRGDRKSIAVLEKKKGNPFAEFESGAE